MCLYMRTCQGLSNSKVFVAKNNNYQKFEK